MLVWQEQERESAGLLVVGIFACCESSTHTDGLTPPLAELQKPWCDNSHAKKALDR